MRISLKMCREKTWAISYDASALFAKEKGGLAGVTARGSLGAERPVTFRKHARKIHPADKEPGLKGRERRDPATRKKW